MGEVYRAHDDRLKRDVAIKVLPPLVAGDPDRLERFQREAQALAALNHPHIAQVFGLEHHDDIRAIVMELVDGPTLAEVIAGHQSARAPMAELLPIARQVADALEAAHDKGIIHRDLKPANIKLTADGRVKVLDFGLAKALSPDSGPGSLDGMNSPTLTARATQMGMILGTAAYMAPEQARGKTVDKRADIWAFGAVIFELVSGRRAFDGEEMTDVLARVIERDPDWSALPASTPPALRRLLERCLTKDPKARLRDIGEARHTLDELIAGRSGAIVSGEWPVVTTSGARHPSARSAATWLPWVMVAAALVLAAAGWYRPSAVSSNARATRVEIALPPDVAFFASPRISADGARVAFVGVREGIRQMFVRELSSNQTTPVPGTEGAISLAFSPDGKMAAVVTIDGRLNRVNIASGGVENLYTGLDIAGLVSWSSDGKLIFSGVNRLLWMPAEGGEAHEILAVDAAGGETLSSPVPTPDGRHVTFTSWSLGVSTQQRLEVVAIDGSGRRELLKDAGMVAAVRQDRLLFRKDAALYSVPFDAARAEVTGPPTQVSSEISVTPTGAMAADVSTDGTIVFADVSVTSGRLVWVSMTGGERSLPLPARGYANPRVSPNGRTVVYSDDTAIWTADLERGSQTMVFKGNDGAAGFPAWSVDGSHLFFRFAAGLLRHRADGEGAPEQLSGTLRQDYPAAVSPDGRLLITRILPASSGDVVWLPVEGGEARVVVGTPDYEGGADLSPDGKWLIYVSNSSGRMEVYLRPFDRTDRYPVSTAGGLHPLWSRDGRRIFFRQGQQMLAVDVTTSPTVRLGAPTVLFERRYSWGLNLTIANYSLSKDGREFLMVREEGGQYLSLIFNWLQ